MRREGDTHGTMCAAMVAANLPTLVPPYFCTSQRAAGSIEFWWRFGGVRGGGVPGADDEVDGEGADEVARLAALEAEAARAAALAHPEPVDEHGPSAARRAGEAHGPGEEKRQVGRGGGGHLRRRAARRRIQRRWSTPGW